MSVDHDDDWINFCNAYVLQVPAAMGRYSPANHSPPRRGHGGRGRSLPPRRGYGGGGGGSGGLEGCGGDQDSVGHLVRNIPLRCRCALFPSSSPFVLPHCLLNWISSTYGWLTHNFAGLRSSVSPLKGSVLWGTFACQETITLGKC
jgi:hypothetical protein